MHTHTAPPFVHSFIHRSHFQWIIWHCLWRNRRSAIEKYDGRKQTWNEINLENNHEFVSILNRFFHYIFIVCVARSVGTVTMRIRGAWCMAFLLPPRLRAHIPLLSLSLFFYILHHPSVARFTFAFFACVERSCLHHHFIVVFISVLVPFWVVPLMVHTRTWCMVSVTQKENSWERHSIVDYKQWNEAKWGSRQRKEYKS